MKEHFLCYIKGAQPAGAKTVYRGCLDKTLPSESEDMYINSDFYFARASKNWDYAAAESFFKTLKTEMVYYRKFLDQKSAKLEIFGYIEEFYNTKSTHSALRYKTPKQMEDTLLE